MKPLLVAVVMTLSKARPAPVLATKASHAWGRLAPLTTSRIIAMTMLSAANAKATFW